jgi:hypothetical protein
MPYKKPPGNINDIRKRIKEFSDREGIPFVRIQDELAYAALTQMLPSNTAVKGGSALSLRYPMTETRYTQDFDIVHKQSIDEFKLEFSENLKKGWNDFTGELVSRGMPADAPRHFEITYLNVKLRYKEKPFATVEMDVVVESFDEVSTSVELENISNSNIFDELMLPIPKSARAISIENQLAQKVDGVANPRVKRPRDLADIQLILRNEPNIDFDKVNEYIVREFKLSGKEYPLNIPHITELNKLGYEKMRVERSNLLPFESALDIAKKLADNAFAAHSQREVTAQADTLQTDLSNAELNSFTTSEPVDHPFSDVHDAFPNYLLQKQSTSVFGAGTDEILKDVRSRPTNDQPTPPPTLNNDNTKGFTL